ncbi:hypothetical protein R1T16_13105 [Flavobacterium sp. DG1-102-2]|uniref:hypothetical protein n=1 Tax=Flavobacterium sp. DG1-102-2 TaxID=3081663 RepID=UPI0029497369|nr:hypothetical protein [Flavobacterium sp. DG1-102-2]MDV6169367.1 hypothetical protein [Flavobacterium sp. DG1-102-2]
MIDKTKVYIQNFVTVCLKSWKYRGNGNYPGQKLYTLKIYNPEVAKKRYAILLCKVVNEDTGEEFIMFENSLRKWYFGRNTRQNLRQAQFNDCIRLLSEGIGVREKDLWNARVTTFEIGINLLLNKKFKNINDCLVRYRGLPREIRFGSVYFHGKKFKITIYDKWNEIFKSKKMNIYQERFAANFHLVRIELGVEKMHGFFKEKASTLADIRDNWDELFAKLVWYIKGIDFVDRISPALSLEDVKTVADFYGYHFYRRINKNFFKNLYKFEKLMFTQNNKSGDIDNFFSSFERGISKTHDFKVEFDLVLDKKVADLYNKGTL